MKITKLLILTGLAAAGYAGASASLWDITASVFGSIGNGQILAPDRTDGGWFFGYSDEKETADGGPGASTYSPGNGVGEFGDAITTQGYLKATLNLVKTTYLYPFTGIGVNFTADPPAVVDISAKGGICLTYASSKAIKLELAGSYGAYNTFTAAIPAAATWTAKTFNFDATTFKQETGWGTVEVLATVLSSSVTGVHFKFSNSAPTNATAVLDIAQIGFGSECSAASAAALTVDLGTTTPVLSQSVASAVRMNISGRSLAFSGLGKAPVAVEVISLNGQVLSHASLNAANATMDLSKVSSGIYLVRANGKNLSMSHKIILQ